MSGRTLKFANPRRVNGRDYGRLPITPDFLRIALDMRNARNLELSKSVGAAYRALRDFHSVKQQETGK